MSLSEGLWIWALTLRRSIQQFVVIYLTISHQEVNKIPIIEFIDSVSRSDSIPYNCKLVGLVDIQDDVTIKDIDSIDYLYETISVNLKNLKMLYDNQYVFDHEKIASVNSFMIDFYEDNGDFTPNDVNKYAKYFIN